MKLADATEVAQVIAQHLNLTPPDHVIAALARGLERFDARDVGVVVEAWMGTHGEGTAYPTAVDLVPLVNDAEQRRWAERSAPASLASTAGAASSGIAHDTAELVRRKGLPPTDAEHLTMEAYVVEMVKLSGRYPAAQWGVAAAELEARNQRDRRACEASAPMRASIGRNRWTDEEQAA